MWRGCIRSGPGREKTDVIATRDHPIAAALQQKGQAALRALQNAETASLAHVYIDARVAAHQDALRLVEQRLLPGTPQPPELRNHLQQLRSTIQAHLTRAQVIRPQLAAAR